MLRVLYHRSEKPKDQILRPVQNLRLPVMGVVENLFSKTGIQNVRQSYIKAVLH